MTRDEEIAAALPADLDALPQLRGFRLRGLEMTRLETFIDAAFAFCVTMMVISVDRIPDNVEELFAAFRNVPAFVFSIAVIGIFWRGHWLWSRRFGLEDGLSILISWGLIVTILVYIYPLKVVFSSMWYFLSDGRVGETIGLQTVAQARKLFLLFAIGFAALCLEVLLLHARAWHLRDALRLDARERATTWAEIEGWSLPLAIGLTSLVLALTLPSGYVLWSGWIYFSLAVLVPIHRRVRRRKILPGPAADGI